IEGATLHFPNNSNQISAADSVLLDSFASRAKQSPSATFTISGHTDSKGKNHEQLSRQRVEAVLAYLQQRHRVPSFRFVPIYAGNAMPLAPNEAESGRQQNRRVEIRQSNYSLPNVMYRNLLLLVKNGAEEEARKTLLAWLNAAENDRKLLLLFDPRLAVFHGTRFWDEVQNRIKKSYQSMKNPNLSYQLDSLWAEDQKPRTLQYHIENLPTYLEDIDAGDSLWQVDFTAMTAATVAEDSFRFRHLEEMKLKNGWPKISELGERPAKAAFLISAHSGDTVALSRLLPMLKNRCMEGEAEWLWYATLYDRWLVLEGKPQRYGTQFKAGANEEERPELLPLENKAKVNEWRTEIGLEPISTD
ncbi:MAG: OmpA family protein, partial [Bacteroidetes bacterium]|nr:OmpA family protein [Bacteroidota bacterium]